MLALWPSQQLRRRFDAYRQQMAKELGAEDVSMKLVLERLLSYALGKLLKGRQS
jgi:hypothetical protein